MAAGYVRLTDPRDGRVWYCRWSTACDAPASMALIRIEVRGHMFSESAGRSALFELHHAFDFPIGPDKRAELELVVKRAWEDADRACDLLDRSGTSWCDHGQSGEASVEFNRAGPREGCLSLTKLLDKIIADRNRNGV